MKKLTPIPNTAVLVETQDEWDEAVELIGLDYPSWDRRGFRDGSMGINISDPIPSNYARIDYYKSAGFTILTLQELKAKLSEGDTMKFKLGQTVKVVRSDALNQKNQIGKVGKIIGIRNDLLYPYRIDGVKSYWSDNELELVERTIRDAQPGDTLVCKSKNVRVIDILPNSLSIELPEGECAWWTFQGTENAGWKIKDTAPPETITHNGKKYDKEQFEAAISGLEEVE